jgi:hypothetical protein
VSNRHFKEIWLMTGCMGNVTISQMKNKIRNLIWVIAAVLALQYCYYGSLTRTCIYTEQELQLPAIFQNSKLEFIKKAAIVRTPAEEFKCLAQMSQIKNRIIGPGDVTIFKDQRVDSIDPEAGLELLPVKLIEVQKHGISTVDSGPGPLQYLIVKDQSGAFYQIFSAGIGVNAGDEFLKLTNSSGSKLLGAT